MEDLAHIVRGKLGFSEDLSVGQLVRLPAFAPQDAKRSELDKINWTPEMNAHLGQEGRIASIDDSLRAVELEGVPFKFAVEWLESIG